MSVSTFWRISGAAWLEDLGEAFHGRSPPSSDRAHVGDAAGDARRPRPSPGWRDGCARPAPGGRRSCGWRSRRCAAPGGTRLAVDGEAHRAAGLAPFEAGVAEDAVEALGFGLALDALRARHDPGRARGRATLRPLAIAAAARRSEMRLLVQEPMNTQSTCVPCDRRAGLEAHVVAAPPAAPSRLSGSGRVAGSGIGSSTAITCSGLVPQVICGAILLTSIVHLAVEHRRRDRWAACASRRRRWSHSAPLGA